MEITTQLPVEEFTVIAGFQNGFENSLETLILKLGDKQVKLNKEQCDELKRVLNGKCHKFFAFRNKEEYQHHSAMYVSSHGQPCKQSVSYTETSFAKLLLIMEIEIVKPTPEQAEFQKLFQNNEEQTIKCLLDEIKELYDKLEAWEKCADRLSIYAEEIQCTVVDRALWEVACEDVAEYKRLKQEQ